MKKLLLLALPLSVIAAPALADPPTDFDARVEAIRKASETPGIGVAIVENGKVVLAKGYGTTTLDGRQKVGLHTVFMIGSTAKAMTTAALATLVDAGNLDWDDRVVDLMPEFAMYDPWVSREMRVKDLLVHRSGLGAGAGDLLYVPRGTYSRKEIVHRLRYVKPDKGFRFGYAYDNILYIVAGQLIEAVSGQSWENYLREHLFKPAGMDDALDTYDAILKEPNRARPFARYGGVIRGIGPQRAIDEEDHLPQASAPAGLVAASPSDMARWLQIQLGQGAIPGGGRLYSEKQARELWTPVTPMPITPAPDPVAETTPSYQSYALGWEVRDYHGSKIVWHLGGIYGSTSVVVMIPEKHVGFAILQNSEEAEPRFGLMYELLDHYLGLPKTDWATRFKAYRDQRVAAAKAVVEQKATEPAGIGPSLPLEAYAGRYADAWYGPVVIAKDTEGLTVNFKPTPDMHGRLEHYQYDTFIARFADAAIEPVYLTFSFDAEGKVVGIKTKAVSPLADFSFDYGDLDLKPVGDNDTQRQ